MAERKVVYVDFRKRGKVADGGFGGGPRRLFAVFLCLLIAEILAAAALYPSAIGSFFFGPTVIAVAVAGTLGVRRLVARYQVARLHRSLGGRPGGPDPDQRDRGRTLH